MSQNRLSLAGALGVIRPYSSYQKPPILSIPAAPPPRAQKKPPLPGEVARRSRDGEVVPSAEAHSRRRQPLSHAPRASSPKRGALKKSPLQGEALAFRSPRLPLPGQIFVLRIYVILLYGFSRVPASVNFGRKDRAKSVQVSNWRNPDGMLQ